MKIGVFRAGCLTGPYHSGVELHGFLSYLVKATIAQRPYTVRGYRGKQVRDHLHSFDLIRAIEEFSSAPRAGEVYNIGGGRQNSASVLEAIDHVEQEAGRKLNWSYTEKNRIGDHICYISDLSKFKRHYPNWGITFGLADIVQEMVRAEQVRQR